MLKNILLTAAIFLAATSIGVQAKMDKKGKPGEGVNPYTHCGIGAALFPDTHWAAVTSNATWDLGTTAIISAISSPDTCNAKKVKTAQLIIETLPDLEKDVAVGEGTYIVALADTMECSAQQDQVTGKLRASYAQVVADPNYAAKSDIERASAMYESARGAAISSGCGAFL